MRRAWRRSEAIEQRPTFDDFAPRLPSRYEDLDESFKGSLRPNEALLQACKAAFSSMRISGGIRFLPVFGESGSGKSSAALEIATHIPAYEVRKVSRESINDPERLEQEFGGDLYVKPTGPLIAVVDEFEEKAADKQDIPKNFVEKLSHLDSSYRGRPVLVIWLTTDKAFQQQLEDATSRRKRLLAQSGFTITGPERGEWAAIVSETFSAHNSEKELADFEVLDGDVQSVADQASTLGVAIERIGGRLSVFEQQVVDLSDYQVVMLWPVTDGKRIETVNRFSSLRQGFRINWHAFANQLNTTDKFQLPLSALNKARLYFDVRLVPIAAADLRGICGDLQSWPIKVSTSSLGRFKSTHLYSIVTRQIPDESYVTLKERDSIRRTEAEDWYKSVTGKPTQIGRAIAEAFTTTGLSSRHEVTETSPHSKVRADVLVERDKKPKRIIVEIKAFSPSNTRPSDIADAIRVTLTRHARFAGFIPRQ